VRVAAAGPDLIRHHDKARPARRGLEFTTTAATGLFPVSTVLEEMQK